MADKQRIILIVFLCVFAFYALRQHAFVDRYAVDVLYWDSWDLYHPLFAGQSWWASFDLQHGPHRQGLGGLLMRVLAQHSRWNSRYDAFSVSFALIIAVPLGAWLAFACGVRGWALLLVPPIYLNIRQCHMFIASANPSHGALPVLLFTAYCLAFFLQREGIRLILQTTLVFLLIFTGFGLFAGLIAPLMLMIEFVHAWRDNAPRRSRRLTQIAIAFIAMGLSWGLFARGYHFDPAVDGFRFPYEHPTHYFLFIGAMLGNYFGLDRATPTAVAVGLAVFVSLLGICVFHLAQAFKQGTGANNRSAVLFCLSAYALIFCTQSAIGRTLVGWQTGALSRYVTLMIPMGLALLIHLSTTPATARRGLPIIYGALLVLGTFSLTQNDLDASRYLHNKCLDWRLAYLQTHDETAADKLVNFPINFTPVTNRLYYLRALRLNLFDREQFKADARMKQP
jgi:hypothetical protein